MRLSVDELLKRALKPGYFAARRVVSALVIDRRLGLDTAREVRVADLRLGGPDRLGYEASAWRVLPKILPPDEVTPDEVFLDYGSGKGRVLYQAARQYPFRRVFGVELSEELNTVARANIARSASRLRCPDVEIVTMDATEYRLPDDVSVVYLYNPFRGEVFADVVANVVASLDRRPRQMRVIYRTPLEEEALLGTGRFRLVRTKQGLRPTRAWRRTSSTRMYVSLLTPEGVPGTSRHPVGEAAGRGPGLR